LNTADSLAQRLSRVRQRLQAACKQHQRNPDDVTLLAVSKTRPVDDVAICLAQQQRHFGENRWPDARDKIDALAEQSLIWHFIGPIQSNKCQAIANAFHWIHSVDRIKIAQRLNALRTDNPAPLQTLIQINIDQEDQKQGLMLNQNDELLALAQTIEQAPNLTLRGLMALPKRHQAVSQQRVGFRQVKQLMKRLNQHGFSMDTLSMGMSADLEAAIAEGSTLIRVGSDIFSPQTHSK